MVAVTQIQVRELRNHVSEVLRRVEAGETMEVTINNRPVALLVPRRDRPWAMSTRQLLGALRPADPGLRDDLAAELTEMTDDLTDPWQR